METPIAQERRGAVAVLRLTHGRANALDVELCEALTDALSAAEQDGAAAIVLTGGGGIFSAGVDLRRVLAGGADYLREFLPALRACFERLAFLERPVVAAVNGHAIAGGFVLLAAADQAVMAGGDGRIGVTELLVGVPFPTIALELVRLRAGTRQAAELAYRGLTCQAAEATSRGLVDEVVEPTALVDRAVELAAALAAAGPAF
ncbi:MAG TPA: enoyl-CoA hydratase/isomerase family protein, partial [Candidatus Dormibacteraeota bacterium]|nr:enoyl-CoA hydratase/isomerase family protein [Candidatus Dormibacteraeota bacterium]